MWKRELQVALKAGKAASQIIMEIYQGDFEVIMKEDQSPVTIADQRADQIIRTILYEKFPTYDFLTEEGKDDLRRLENDYVWIVDPLDGTKDFVHRHGEFTINIALSYRHEIVVGVIVAPVCRVIYYATKEGGAHRLENGKTTKIYVNNLDKNLTVLASRFHLTSAETALFEKYKDIIIKVETVGSSLKACRIAEGKAELSYRLSAGTKEWDIAASQLLIEEAGGVLLKPDLTRYQFNRSDVVNREGYVIANKIENILL
ncbi:MAG: 3'(2'),5'-bisphosphate nucleotidase CysQ family protein [Bacilli bacterium]|jgi:3'(2'), 5'-bisphosphate nucleotidase